MIEEMQRMLWTHWTGGRTTAETCGYKWPSTRDPSLVEVAEIDLDQETDTRGRDPTLAADPGAETGGDDAAGPGPRVPAETRASQDPEETPSLNLATDPSREIIPSQSLGTDPSPNPEIAQNPNPETVPCLRKDPSPETDPILESAQNPNPERNPEARVSLKREKDLDPDLRASPNPEVVQGPNKSVHHESRIKNKNHKQPRYSIQQLY